MKPGDKIDDYTLLHECGRGAFGTVFLAKDRADQYVALKAVSLLGDGGDRELQALESYKKELGKSVPAVPLCDIGASLVLVKN